jgi:hypothetical protein
VTHEVVDIALIDVQQNADGTYRRSKVFFWDADFDPHQHLQRRTHLPYEMFRQSLLPRVWDVMGFVGADRPSRYESRWAQKAGCSNCDCSPGFIVDRRWGYDLHVTYRNVTPAQLRERRLRQVGIRFDDQVGTR